VQLKATVGSPFEGLVLGEGPVSVRDCREVGGTEDRIYAVGKSASKTRNLVYKLVKKLLEIRRLSYRESSQLTSNRENSSVLRCELFLEGIAKAFFNLSRIRKIDQTISEDHAANTNEAENDQYLYLTQYPLNTHLHMV
jgi:uncharacterized DUF497 family protein